MGEGLRWVLGGASVTYIPGAKEKCYHEVKSRISLKLSLTFGRESLVHKPRWKGGNRKQTNQTQKEECCLIQS